MSLGRGLLLPRGFVQRVQGLPRWVGRGPCLLRRLRLLSVGHGTPQDSMHSALIYPRLAFLSAPDSTVTSSAVYRIVGPFCLSSLCRHHSGPCCSASLLTCTILYMYTVLYCILVNAGALPLCGRQTCWAVRAALLPLRQESGLPGGQRRGQDLLLCLQLQLHLEGTPSVCPVPGPHYCTQHYTTLHCTTLLLYSIVVRC